MEVGVVLTACVGKVKYAIHILLTFNWTFKVPCPSLADPNNGIITCSLGDDGVPSNEDTCSFTCNTGYELTGSDNRTCQSNGNWSGTESVCIRGMCVCASNVYQYILCLCC